jgi:hypothetical protein
VIGREGITVENLGKEDVTAEQQQKWNPHLPAGLPRAKEKQGSNHGREAHSMREQAEQHREYYKQVRQH